MDYRKILNDYFESRVTGNPRYSLRAYARDLNISAPSLSLILKKKQGLSLANATEIAQRLNLDKEEKAIFLASVASQHARQILQRKNGAKSLRLLLEENKVSSISLRNFSAISKWYHLAIVECLRNRPALSVEGLSSALGIEREMVQAALHQLRKTGILRSAKKKWKVLGEIFSASSRISSLAIRGFHHEILRKAAEAVDVQSTTERDLSAALFNFDPARLSELQADLARFRLELLEKYSTNSPDSELYCFSNQFFMLTKNLRRCL